MNMIWLYAEVLKVSVGTRSNDYLCRILRKRSISDELTLCIGGRVKYSGSVLNGKCTAELQPPIYTLSSAYKPIFWLDAGCLFMNQMLLSNSSEKINLYRNFAEKCWFWTLIHSTTSPFRFCFVLFFVLPYSFLTF